MFKNLMMCFSFFTTLPVINVEFKQANYKYLPLLIFVVGLVIGILSYGLLLLLNLLYISLFLKSVILVSFYLIITGGIHFDGLLDSVDGYFSRQTVKRKLEIMHDSNIGAFACIFAIIFIIIKIAIIQELLIRNDLNTNIILIPIISRILVSLMICTSKYASNHGLAKLYSTIITKSYRVLIILQLLALTIVISAFKLEMLIVLTVALMFYWGYLKMAYRNFNGITGDLLGGFLEMSELIMFISLVVI